MARVTVVQRRLTEYRVPFFEALKRRLSTDGIALDLLAGEARSTEKSKADAGMLSWAEELPTRYLFNERICWQPVHSHLRETDLAIVTQENALLANHLLLLKRPSYRVAFWGHGANLQAKNPSSWRERFKRWETTKVDWWFAYTEMSAQLVREAGFPSQKITVVNNAVDTVALAAWRDSIDTAELALLRSTLGFGTDPVAVFLGSLHADKRLDFLLEACDRLRVSKPEIKILFVGDGPERDTVLGWCNARTGCAWVGARHDREKALYLSLGTLMLNPGLVGLGVLDSFVFELPLVTTDCGLHSPEIVYLKNEQSGLITDNSIASYVDGCLRILDGDHLLAALRRGCRAAAQEYTLENMVERFANGVVAALS